MTTRWSRCVGPRMVHSSSLPKGFACGLGAPDEDEDGAAVLHSGHRRVTEHPPNPQSFFATFPTVEPAEALFMSKGMYANESYI